MRRLLILPFLLFCATGSFAQLRLLTSFSGDELVTASVTQADGRIFFVADDDGQGEALYYVEPDGEDPVLVKRINPNGNSGINSNIAAFRDGVVFRADDGNVSAELWYSDGTAAGTRLVKDINPNGGSFPEDFHSFAGQVYFLANDGTHGKELWRSDGTEAGTQLVKNIGPGNADGTPANTGIIYGASTDYLFFRADDGSTGFELYVTDGTTDGTRLVADLFAGQGSGLGETNPEHAAIFQNTLYFRGHDGGAATGKELRYFNPATESIDLVREINIGANAQADVKHLFVSGDLLFFRAKENSDGVEAYVTDGTAAGTIRLGDQNPKGGSSPVYSLADPATNRVFYQANTGSNGREPWVSDGTVAGTREITDLVAGGSSQPDFLAFSEGLAYFAANTDAGSISGAVGRELFATDGSQVYLVADLNAGPDPGNPAAPAFTLADGRIVFVVNSSELGKNIYCYTPQQFVALGEPLDFGAVNLGTRSAALSFRVEVSGVGSPVAVVAPTGFSVSLTEAGGYTESLTLTPDGSGLISTDVFVRFVPVLPSPVSDRIAVSGDDIIDGFLSVSGEGVNALPDGLFAFDRFEDPGLPPGWSEGGETSGQVLAEDGHLVIVYDPERPVAVATRSLAPATGTVYLNFLYRTDRQTMNGPVSIRDTDGNELVQLRFQNGVRLVTQTDGTGEPAEYIDLVGGSNVPKGVDMEIGLVLDLAGQTVSVEISGDAPVDAQGVPLLNGGENVASVAYALPYMFGDGGQAMVDDFMIGSVYKWALWKEIRLASELAAQATVGTEPNTYPRAALDRLYDAIFAANEQFVTLLDQSAIDIAALELQRATEVFLNSLIAYEATVTIDPEQGHPVHEGFFGYNNRSIDQAWSYRNPEFVDALKTAKAGWMRYLSGTISDPFNMNTGLYEEAWVKQFDASSMERAFRFAEVKGPQTVYDLYQALGEAGAKLIVTWPGFMAGPEEAGIFAKFCADNDIVVEYWQLNNEPFFFMPGRNAYFYNDGTDYMDKMLPINNAIKANYPGSQVAPSISFGVVFDRGFAAEIGDYSPKFYDLVSFHSYGALANPSSDDLALRNGNAGVKIGGTDAPRKMLDHFGEDTRYFVTEYNVFNNVLGGTFFSGIYNAEFLLRNSVYPQMEYLGLHVFNTNVVQPIYNHSQELEDAYANGTAVEADSIAYGIEVSVAGQAILTAVEALNNSNFSLETTVTGGDVVAAEHPNSLVDAVPALFARAYRGSNDKDYLVITNRSDAPHRISLTGLQLPNAVTVTSISTLEPLTRSAAEETVEVLDLNADPTLRINGYSVTRLEWTVGARAPKKNRLFKRVITEAGIDLKWWQDESADGYKIVSGPHPDNLKDEIVVMGSENNSYSLPLRNARKRYYGIVAFNAAGESPVSNLMEIRWQQPAQPELVRARSGDGQATLLWKSVRGANGYTIHYGTSPDRLDQRVDARNTSGFPVRNLQNDLTYYFAVEAYNGAGTSGISNTLTAVPRTALPLAPKKVHSENSVSGTVALVWEPNAGQNLTYNVYRSTNPWKGYERIATGVTEHTYTDAVGQLAGGTYYYVVRAENEVGESFFPSNIWTVQVDGTTTTASGELNPGELRELSVNSILVAGNPVPGDIQLLVPAEVEVRHYQLIDLQGRQLADGVLSGSGRLQVPFDLPRGAYVLRVAVANGEAQSFRVVKP